MRRDIAFLHTSSEHVATFDALMAELAPKLAIRHDVDTSVLAQARTDRGIDRALQGRIEQSMLAAGSSGAKVLVCTCSTIGAVAEPVGQGRSVITQRIDRAMADTAVDIGPRILVVAALRSTVGPTRKLITSSASRNGRLVSFQQLVVEDAWHYFERSMPEANIERIVAAVSPNTDQADVIVLAQASMALAAEELRDLRTPVLASTRLGAETAIRAYERIA